MSDIQKINNKLINRLHVRDLNLLKLGVVSIRQPTLLSQFLTNSISWPLSSSRRVILGSDIGLLTMEFYGFTGNEDKREMKSSSAYDVLPSDESFFHALVAEQSPDEKNVALCCDDNENCFIMLWEQVSSEDSYTEKLEIDEFLGGDFCMENLLSLEAFLRVLDMKAPRKDLKVGQCGFANHKESGASLDEAWLDELMFADFHQPRPLLAFLTNFVM